MTPDAQPHPEMNDTASRDAQRRRYLLRLLFLYLLFLSVSRMAKVIWGQSWLSALLASHKSRFKMIVLILITLVIAAAFAKQIMLQSNKLDFLPPDVPLADCGAARRAARGFDLQPREGAGWRHVWSESRNTACLGIVSGHWFRSQAADTLCQVVEMQ